MNLLDKIAAVVFRRLKTAEARLMQVEPWVIGEDPVLDKRVLTWGSSAAKRGSNLPRKCCALICASGVGIENAVKIGAKCVIGSVTTRVERSTRHEVGI